MTRLKVLLSAYACEPGKGSEPGVGWNIARQIARYHEVWVITRSNNRSAIEAESSRQSTASLHFLYYDLPRWAKAWKRGRRGVQLYYYLWQIGIYFVARRLHRRVEFDLVHHITFGKYWSPSFLCLLPVPFVWGPVGGGESAPKSFWKEMGIHGKIQEALRESARWVSQYDPFIRLTARRCVWALAKTPATASRLKHLGIRRVELLGESAISSADMEQLNDVPSSNGKSHFCRFVSIGNLLPLKAFHLGLLAFARAGKALGEYWIIGNGPELKKLQALVNRLDIADRVTFWGELSRGETLSKLRECHVLVHPSLHDSGGWVCLESMAAGRPVVCLDLGGPATQVTEETGFKLPAHTPGQAVQDLTRAMQRLAQDPALRARMGQAARDRVASTYTWKHKGEILNSFYAEIVGSACIPREIPEAL
jgi:glycosyltransferase involved in cell wall biosynthesis